MHCDIYTPLLPFSVKPNPFFQTSPLATLMALVGLFCAGHLQAATAALVFMIAMVMSYPENSFIGLLPLWVFLLISGFLLL